MSRVTAIVLAGLVLLPVPSAAQPDRAAFAHWLAEQPERMEQVRAFEAYLSRSGVGNVLPSGELLLNATNWKPCRLMSPYSMPPRGLWPHIVTTLTFIRDEVEPVIGPVTVESGYREPRLNRCAGGAPKSAHAQFYALDLIPLRAMTRQELIKAICHLHRERGKSYNVGLGFYDGLRFHIDTKAYRRWGSDNHINTSPCNRP